MSKGGSGLLTALPGSRDGCTPVEGFEFYSIDSVDGRVYSVRCDRWSPHCADKGLEANAMVRAGGGLCGIKLIPTASTLLRAGFLA